MIEIPKQLQNPEFRFVLLKPKTKIPFEKNWQKEGYKFDDPKLLKHLEDGGNYGIIGGYGGLRVLDDDKTIKEYDDIQTFTIRSGGGRRHFYFISDYDKNHVLTDGKGELRANNYQVVCPGCIHPSGNKYEIINDLPILSIKGDELKKIIEPFIRTDGTANDVQIIDENKPTDQTRSGREFGEVCRLIRKGLSKEGVFESMMAFAKWSDAPQQYRELTYNKALKKVVSLSQQSQETPEIKEEIEKILSDPKLFDLIIKEFDKKIVGEENNKKTIFLASCGIYVENHDISSYNLHISSGSGAGKDYIAKHILNIFPKGFVESRTRITPAAFTYWHNSKFEPEWSWDGKICYLQDVSYSVMNSDTFKVMTSEGSYATVVMDQRAIDIKINGKPVMIITAAETNPKNQMLRRFPIISLDESKKQTKEIMKRQAEWAKEGTNPKTEYSEIIIMALGALKRVKVKIPFTDVILGSYPFDHIIMRTHFSRLLDLIKCSAALHQYQRERDEQNNIIAEPKDYCIAIIALQQMTQNALMIPLTKKQQKFIELCKTFKDGWFAAAEIVGKCSFLSERSVYSYLDNLQEIFFEVDSFDVEGVKKPVKKYKLKAVASIKIPTYKECQKIAINSTSTNTTNNSIITNNPINCNNCNNCSANLLEGIENSNPENPLENAEEEYPDVKTPDEEYFANKISQWRENKDRE
jgi:hypothetical protein